MNKIIVVDDDEIFCGLLKTVLEFENYEVIIEANPNNVVMLARREQPILILMDVHSDQGDTLGVLKELKTNAATQAIPVVMASGMDRSDECMKAGASDFILKPFRPDELISLVTKATAQ